MSDIILSGDNDVLIIESDPIITVIETEPEPEVHIINSIEVGPQGLRGPQGPSGISDSVYEIKLIDDMESIAIGTNIVVICVPSEKNGMKLINAQAMISTPSNEVVSYQVTNLTDGVNMLSIPITIDIGSYSSYNALVPSVIDGTKDDIATADRIGVSKITAGTTEKGDTIILTFGV